LLLKDSSQFNTSLISPIPMLCASHINRNHDHLISKWSAGMDVVRHQAISQRKYELYFCHGTNPAFH
jgi:hypothetical protein